MILVWASITITMSVVVGMFPKNGSAQLVPGVLLRLSVRSTSKTAGMLSGMGTRAITGPSSMATISSIPSSTIRARSMSWMAGWGCMLHWGVSGLTSTMLLGCNTTSLEIPRCSSTDASFPESLLKWEAGQSCLPFCFPLQWMHIILSKGDQ